MSKQTTAGKACTRCNRTKPLSAFGIHPGTRDTRQSWCLECHREYARQHRAADPLHRAYDKRQRDAYAAAERRLRLAHRDQFDALYQDEKRKRGIA